MIYKFLLFSFLFVVVNSNKIDDCAESIVPEITEFPPYEFRLAKNKYAFTIYELEESTGAKCLDGSNYKFLYQKGSGEGVNKIMFMFEGAAYCSSENYDVLTSCSIRSQNYTGTSTLYGNHGETHFFGENLAHFADEQEINPLFYNWNKIYLHSCDGTFFQGSLEEPLSYFNTTTNETNKLWFRGYNNTFSTLEYARKFFGLFDMQEVIITGLSSGGQSIIIWASFIRNYLPSSIKLYGISDGGLILDIVNTNNGCHLARRAFMNIANLTNSYNLDLFSNCSFRKNKSEIWKCLSAEYILESIDVKFFFANSQNDFEIMRSSYGLQCLSYGISNCEKKDHQKINEFRGYFLNHVLNLKKKKPTWGFWIRKCIEHTYSQSVAWLDFKVFSAESLQSKNFRDALTEWYMNKDTKSTVYIDIEDWKTNCPPIKGDPGYIEN